ncbi:ATP-binding cassette domain-containing protein [Streptococcus ruminantium]|uniref:ATP-binding cassette domain-containing protein n=1 Tax=Streptococcus ruminantium TaxID=1917441 RepID=UPI001F39833D|nr:ABC transporter ATP-binding protein [Streptococcus ruminantium]BDD39482.1 ABC transporter ATP-binding and permease protein [Streptococcus ruminantium]
MRLKQVWRILPKFKICLLLLALVGASFDGIIMSQVISRVSKFSSESTVKDILLFAGCSILFYLLIQLSDLFVSIIKNDLLKNLHKKYKMELLNYLGNKGNALDITESLAVLTVDLKLVEDKYFSVLFDCLHYSLLGAVSLIYLVYLSPAISVLFIIFSFLPMLPAILFSKYLGTATENFTKSNEKFIRSIKDIFQGFSVLWTYGANRKFLGMAETTVNDLENSNEALNNKHSIVNLVSSMLSWLSYIVPITVALVFVTQGKLDASIVIALFLASDRVIYPFRNVSNYLRMIQSTEQTRKKLEKMLQDSQQQEVSENHIDESILTPEIQFSGVAIGHGMPIIKKFNATVPYGRKILIRGASGSGKTTLLDSIQGVLQPLEGEISVLDRQKKINNPSNQMARIQQSPYYFEASLKENLLMALESVREEKLLALLSALGLVEELGEDCLEKYYGENGAQLSGGQKQRIEIARALLHNKKILLIDEGTSAIDKKSSTLIRNKLAQLPITIFEVAHHYTESDLSLYDEIWEIQPNSGTIEKIL